MKEWIFFGMKGESEIAVVATPHGCCSSRSIRRVPIEESGRWYAVCSTASEEPRGNYNLELKEES